MATQLEPTDVPPHYTVVKNPVHLQTPTCTITFKKDESVQMRAVEFHGRKDMKVCKRVKPMITDPVGSMPGLKSGDVVGHEFMGIVESVGPQVKGIKADRMVCAFDIACGRCSACNRKDFAGCDTTNPSKEMQMLYHDRSAGFFGYSHLTGGWERGQAEFVRVPFADLNCLKVPAELEDERVVLLSDILPTAWHANEFGQVGEGDNVAIWGAGLEVPIKYFNAMENFVEGS